MSKRTIPEGSEILPPIAKRVTPSIVIEDDSDDQLRADQRGTVDYYADPGNDRVPEWFHRPGLRYAQLQCRMRHVPASGTCKHCAIIIE